MDYNTNCISCGAPIIGHHSGRISPAQVKDIKKYCSQCLSQRKHQIWEDHLKNHTHKQIYKKKRYVNKRGYVYIRVNGVYQAEHRVIMGKKLGRSLKKGELVHHIDGNPSNNAVTNLELWLNTHVLGIKASDLICPHCGKSYILSDNPLQFSFQKQRIR